MRWIFLLVIVANTACAGSAGTYLPAPRGEGYRVASGEDSPLDGAEPYPARHTAFLDNGDLRIAFSLQEWRDFLVLRVRAHNSGADAMEFRAVDLVLVDSNRMALRSIAVHDVANSLLAAIQDPPRYSPKYVATTRDTPGGTTTIIEEDGWSKAAQSFGDAWTRSGNNWIRQTAHDAYMTGLADPVSVPPKTGLAGNLYFARPKTSEASITLRIISLDVEIPFVWGTAP